jgi:hypothetical protein
MKEYCTHSLLHAQQDALIQYKDGDTTLTMYFTKILIVGFSGNNN